VLAWVLKIESCVLPSVYTLAQAEPGILLTFRNLKDTERMGKLSDIQRFTRKDASFFTRCFRQARFAAMPPGPQQALGPMLQQIANDEPLTKYGLWADWYGRPQWKLCDAPGGENGSKVEAIGAFLEKRPSIRTSMIGVSCLALRQQMDFARSL